MGVKEDPLKPKGANQKLYKTFKKRSYLHAQITIQECLTDFVQCQKKQKILQNNVKKKPPKVNWNHSVFAADLKI